MLSALLVFLHRTLCDPYRLLNSTASKPFPSVDTKTAEFFRER